MTNDIERVREFCLTRGVGSMAAVKALPTRAVNDLECLDIV